MTRYAIQSASTTIVVEARSSMGPITFEGLGATGWVDAKVADGRVVSASGACLTLPVANLQSGNDMFDAELLRRVSARIHPNIDIELESAEVDADSQRIELRGRMTMHGVSAILSGTVSLMEASEERIVVAGEHVVDIRNFNIPAPTVLMLKIYPDVRVMLIAEAVRSDDRPAEGA